MHTLPTRLAQQVAGYGDIIHTHTSYKTHTASHCIGWHNTHTPLASCWIGLHNTHTPLLHDQHVKSLHTYIILHGQFGLLMAKENYSLPNFFPQVCSILFIPSSQCLQCSAEDKITCKQMTHIIARLQWWGKNKKKCHTNRLKVVHCRWTWLFDHHLSIICCETSPCSFIDIKCQNSQLYSSCNTSTNHHQVYFSRQ